MIATRKRTPVPAKSAAVRRIPDWEAAGLAGLVGGTAFVALEMAFTALFGGSAWDAPRLIAAVVFGGTLPAQSNAFMLTLAVAVHFTLSLVYARVLSLYLTFRRGGAVVLVGAAFGLLLYVVNLHVLGAALPRLAAAQGWPWLLSHAGFGMVTAWTYRRLERGSCE